MRRIFFYFIPVVLLIFVACQKEQKEEPKGLKLTLLNKEAAVFCPNNDCTKIPDSISIKEYLKASTTTIKFKIENLDEQQPYVFVPFCFNSWETGCSPIYSFPDRFAQLDLNNLLFTDSKNEKVKIEGFLGKLKNDKIEKYQYVLDSLTKSYYKSFGYSDKPFKWKVTNENITKRMMVIQPKEQLFFEVPVNLPINYNAVGSIMNQVNLKKTESYKINLVFNTKIDSIERFLTSAQLKTFKTNNYKFFNKELVSSNSIDVKFVD